MILGFDIRYFKKRYYAFKAIKAEFFDSLFSALMLVISYYFYKDRDQELAYGLLIVGIFFFLLIRSKGRERNFFYIPFLTRDDVANWNGRGTFDYVKSVNAFHIADSPNGFIFSKALLWNNYNCRFKFKIVNSSISVIVRALDLSNYLMFQVFDDKVKPHIKVNGLWVCHDPQKTNNPEYVQLLPIKNKLSLDKWYAFEISCDRNLINMSIKDKGKVLFSRGWPIPSIKVLFPVPVQPQPFDIPFSVDLDYGSIGFRNCPPEMAYVKDLYVEAL